MMRRAFLVLVVALLGVGLPSAALAGPKRMCRISDGRLTELSGLAATRTGYTVVNDGVDEPAGRRIFFLDKGCEVVRTVAYPSRPRDTEDLGYAPDGTLWVADIGDNGSSRTTIALWRLAPGSRSPQLFRLRYPDGAHDAEALLVSRTGVPVLVTKTVGSATVYVPESSPRAGRVTPLRQAGTVTVPVTTTSNPFGLPGRLVVTGGAVSPDGRYAALRTYADAFEFDVPDGDLVRALTRGTPRTIALPDEPQGESVAYTTDGSALLTVSEGSTSVLRYPVPGRPATPTTSPAATKSPPPAAAPAATAAASARRARLSAGAVITGGVLIAAAAVLAVVTVRRGRRVRD